MKRLLIAILLTISLNVMADPAPFGLEIGKTTIKEATSKYRAQKKGINKYSGGDMYKLSGINFEGLQDATAIFSKDGKLLALLTILSTDRFDYLLNSLGKKYQLISSDTPFVGNKSAKLIDGNTEIILSAPHMSFEMEMDYIHKDLWKVYETQSNEEEHQKQKKELSQL